MGFHQVLGGHIAELMGQIRHWTHQWFQKGMGSDGAGHGAGHGVKDWERIREPLSKWVIPQVLFLNGISRFYATC